MQAPRPHTRSTYACVSPYFRLWDAVGGFLFLFANMQEKLSKNATQVDLLQELLNLQKDLIVMLLSMLEGEATKTAAGL